MEKDVILAKISIVRNCLQSVVRATGQDPSTLDDQFVQDVFVLNLERATQACIDMANQLIASNGWMMPSSYRQAFTIIGSHKVIMPATVDKMQKMAGFRNIAIHDYQQLDLNILKSILSKNLGDLEEFCREVHLYLKR